MTAQAFDLTTQAAADAGNYNAAMRRAGRRGAGVGLMFLGGFGTVWLVGGCSNAGMGMVGLLLIGLIGAALVALGLRISRETKLGQFPGDDSPAFVKDQAERARQFNRVNAAQWLAVAALIVTLNIAGKPEWIMAGVILIVGLHFFPLARTFRTRSHLVTGAALVLIAIVYPLLTLAGPASPIGAIATGLVLWTHASYALLKSHFFDQQG